MHYQKIILKIIFYVFKKLDFMKNQSSDEFASHRCLLARKSSTKLLIAIGFDSQDLECLDLHNINEGWKVLTR